MKVLLTGAMVPPNYGPDYSKKFNKIFENIAQSQKVLFFPFILKDVAGEPSLNISDGIHPNAQGYKVIANNLLPLVRKLLNE